MTVLVATTVAAYKCDGIGELAWLQHSEAWRAAGHEFFCAVQSGHGHDHNFAQLETWLEDLEATVWRFSIDTRATEITSGNRLQGICTGRNMAHEYVTTHGDITHLLLLDSDVMPCREAIDLLLEVDHPIVGGHVPTYCLDGPRVTEGVPSSADVREHWNTAGFLLLQREAVNRIRWGWSLDDGLTDDPWTQDLAVRVGLGQTWVRHDCVGIHWPPMIGPLETRGHDLTIKRPEQEGIAACAY